MNEYVRERFVGSGGYGSVSLARRLGDNKLVAVKIVRFMEHRIPERYEQAIRTFTTEWQALNLIRRSGATCVPEPIETFSCKGVPVLVMEFVGGETLSEVTRKHAEGVRVLNDRQIISIFWSAVRGLSSIHAASWILRDIKPANIIVTDPDGPAPECVFIDVGVATVAPQPGTKMAPGSYAGTTIYMCADQQKGAVSFSSDIYSLGLSMASLVAALDENSEWQDVLSLDNNGNPTDNRFYKLGEIREHALGGLLIRMNEFTLRGRFKTCQEVIDAGRADPRSMGQGGSGPAKHSRPRASQGAAAGARHRPASSSARTVNVVQAVLNNGRGVANGFSNWVHRIETPQLRRMDDLLMDVASPLVSLGSDAVRIFKSCRSLLRKVLLGIASVLLSLLPYWWIGVGAWLVLLVVWPIGPGHKEARQMADRWIIRPAISVLDHLTSRTKGAKSSRATGFDLVDGVKVRLPGKVTKTLLPGGRGLAKSRVGDRDFAASYWPAGRRPFSGRSADELRLLAMNGAKAVFSKSVIRPGSIRFRVAKAGHVDLSFVAEGRGTKKRYQCRVILRGARGVMLVTSDANGDGSNRKEAHDFLESPGL